jgi:hypothetical protein
MKRILWRPATFIVIIVFGVLGLSLPAAEQSAPTKIEGASNIGNRLTKYIEMQADEY